MYNIKELRQRRADLVNEGRTAIEAAIAAGRKLTDAEKQRDDSIALELKDLDQDIARVERLMDAERKLLPVSGAHVPDGPRIVVGRNNNEDEPFKDHRDFLRTMMNETVSRRIDARLNPYRATQGSDEQGLYSDPHGGYFLPVTVMPGVLSVSPEQDPIAGRVTPIPMESEIVMVNARVDKNHATSVSGGLTVTRRAETSDGVSSRMAFEPITLHAHELFGFAFATERVLEASPGSFMAILAAGFGDEFAANGINERLNGSGTGEFLGVLNSPSLITVSKETGQAAATIVTENIDKMAARCWRYGQAIYLANHNTRPQLKGLVRAVGTGGQVVPYFETNPNGQETLDGRPIFFTEFAKTLGTAGDLILGTWSQYLEGTYHGVRQAESIHVRFLANERAFKFWKMNDGQPWWKTVLTPRNGDTLSPFVVLETR